MSPSAEDPAPREPSPDAAAAGDGRLDSWKEIASYLNRDVRTVQRWEKDEGLPVHRLLHGKQGSVYARRAELDAWWESRRQRVEHEAVAAEAVAAEARRADGHRVLTRPRWWRHPAALVAAGASIALAIVAVLALRDEPQVPAGSGQVVRLSIAPATASVWAGLQSPPAISPDGRSITFAAPGSSGVPRLWLRRLDALDAIELPRTERAQYPFWSPDSQSIGFFADGKLQVTSVSGGPPRLVCPAPRGHGGSWNQQGQILFAADEIGGLYGVPASGGEPRQVTAAADPITDSHRNPFFLPDGDRFLFSIASWVRPPPEHVGVYVSSLSGRIGMRRLLPDQTNAIYVPGFVLFVRQGALVAQRFALDTLAPLGEPTTVATSIASWLQTGGIFSASATGHLAYLEFSRASELAWLDRAGSIERLGVEPEGIAQLRLSPDAGSASGVIRAAEGTTDLWRLDLASRRRTRLTSSGGNWFPVWSPDGTQVLFSSYATGSPQLMLVPAAGGESTNLLSRPGDDQVARDWSQDGRFLLYNRGDYDSNGALGPYGLALLDLKTRESRFVVSEASGGALSPDGRWVAYQDESNQIWVQAVSGSPKWQVSSGTGFQPQWRADGRQIAYRQGDTRIVAAEFSPETGVATGSAEVLFEHPGLRAWDLTADFSRALVTLDPTGGRQPLTVVLNWAAELPTR